MIFIRNHKGIGSICIAKNQINEESLEKIKKFLSNYKIEEYICPIFAKNSDGCIELHYDEENFLKLARRKNKDKEVAILIHIKTNTAILSIAK